MRTQTRSQVKASWKNLLNLFSEIMVVVIKIETSCLVSIIYLFFKKASHELVVGGNKFVWSVLKGQSLVWVLEGYVAVYRKCVYLLHQTKPNNIWVPALQNTTKYHCFLFFPHPTTTNVSFHSSCHPKILFFNCFKGFKW